MSSDTDPLKLLEAVERVYSSLSVEARSELRLTIDSLSKRLETPWETTKRIVWQEPCVKACIYTLIDLGVFQRWTDAGAGVQSPEDLCRDTACDPLLLDRLLRNLAANNLLVNHGPGKYAMTEFAKSLAKPDQRAAYWYSRKIQSRMLDQLPSYLREKKYSLASPSSRSTAFSQAFRTDDTFFAYLSKHPDLEKSFALCMQGVSESMESWVKIYPTEQLVQDAEDKQLEVVLVDVGGGIGHDINAFQRKHRIPPGRLILQDSAKVLKQAKVEPNIEVMPYDFFRPQTVKARAYYLHSILHDWPDDEACAILENLKSAMSCDSIILLHELVRDCPITSRTATWMDITMLAAFNSRERNLEEWQTLAERAGLKMTGHSCHPDTPYSIIKLELATNNICGGYRAAAYYVNWATYARNHQPHDLPVENLTHVFYAFANISMEDGKVFLSDPYADTDKVFPSDTWSESDKTLKGCLGQLFLLKKKNRRLKTLLSIGGSIYSQNIGNAISTEQGRQNFAQTAV
ncbi:S-adenosyl-L-methionine-dependent methyltransferase, partial [Aureobasidium melanogenum]